MLIDLKILNGNLELKYNEYTYEYTVKVDNTVNSLNIEYKLTEGTSINIRNNILTEGENKVYLDVFDSENYETYTLIVYKQEIEEVSGIDMYLKSLEVNNTKEELELYKVQILSISIFLIIILLFSLIFKRKKINYKYKYIK